MVVERLAWHRRPMAHGEFDAVIAVGFAKLALISIMLKRLTEPT
jgi:hypothetical protein